MDFEVDFLSWSHFSEKNVGMGRTNGVLSKYFLLGALWDPLELVRVDGAVDEFLFGVRFCWTVAGFRIDRATSMQFKDNCVDVCGFSASWQVIKLSRVSVDGNEAESVAQNFILDD